MFAWFLGSSTQAPVLWKIRSSKALIILTVSTAVFTDVFIYEMVVPVLPFALGSRAGVPSHSVQTWISILLAVYGGATLIASPFCGYLADQTKSRRPPFVLGLLALAGSTALLFVGDSTGVLVAGRVLQGISAAVVGVVGLALLADTTGSDGVGQAMGYVGLSMSLAILTGPMLSGIVYATAGYSAVFAMGFGLIGLDCVLRLSVLERRDVDHFQSSIALSEICTPKPTPTGVHHAGAIVGLSGNETSAISAPFSTPDRDVPGRQDTRQDQALTWQNTTGRLPPILYLLTSSRLLSALWAIMVQASLLTALDSILPLYVRNTFHWNSIGAGLIFLPIVVVSFVAPLIGQYSDRYGARWFATIGFLVACPCLILLRLVQRDDIGQKVLLCALLAIFALGSTLVITPIMAEITHAVDAKMKQRPPGFWGRNGAYAQAYGLFNMAWAAGGLIGPLLGGLISQRAGWASSTLVLGLVSVATAIPTYIWTGERIRKRRVPQQVGEAHYDGTEQ